MKIEYTGRHIEVTPAIRKHTEDHFGKLRHLFEQNNAKAHVVIAVERGRHKCEISVKWAQGLLNASTVTDDMYQSISKSITKLEKQALTTKNKVIEKKHKPTKAKTANKSDVATKDSVFSDVRSFAPKALAAAAAVKQLSKTKDAFVVYRDDDTKALSIAYKIDTDGFGLLVVE